MLTFLARMAFCRAGDRESNWERTLGLMLVMPASLSQDLSAAVGGHVQTDIIALIVFAYRAQLGGLRALVDIAAVQAVLPWLENSRP
jgi:hypothetical protein